jgi:hypothetical protein
MGQRDYQIFIYMRRTYGTRSQFSKPIPGLKSGATKYIEPNGSAMISQMINLPDGRQVINKK